MLPLAIVVAMTPKRVIGKNGALPWHIPEDLKHFRTITTGHAIVMGRRTFESIGRALPNRTNIVVTRDPAFSAPSCKLAHTFEDAIELARKYDNEPQVIGGTQLYKHALPVATRMLVTYVVGTDYTGDIYFPKFDASAWREVSRSPSKNKDLIFAVLERAH